MKLFRYFLIIFGLVFVGSMQSCGDKDDNDDQLVLPDRNPSNGSDDSSPSGPSANSKLLGIWMEYYEDDDFGKNDYAERGCFVLEFEDENHYNYYSIWETRVEAKAEIVYDCPYTYDETSNMLLLHMVEPNDNLWEDDDYFVEVLKVQRLTASSLFINFLYETDGYAYSYANDMRVINRVISAGYKPEDEAVYMTRADEKALSAALAGHKTSIFNYNFK